MLQIFKKTTLLMILFTCCVIAAKAQDVIIKNDKSEIKSKVTEITETVIKYKKWDHQDGPTYNISKTEVFMIIYANGQREIIKPATSPAVESKPTETKAAPVETKKATATEPATKRRGQSVEITETTTSNTGIDTTVDYKKLKVKYAPSRIVVGFHTPVTMGADAEVRIVKNILNLGVTYYFAFPESDYVLETNTASLYASVYAPINRLMKNYKKQDRGFFVFAHAGYGASWTKYKGYNGKTYTESSSAFTWRLGVDYAITKGFGVSLSTYEFKTHYAGIIVSFL